MLGEDDQSCGALFQRHLQNLESLWAPHYRLLIHVQRWALIGQSLDIFMPQTERAFVIIDYVFVCILR